MEWSPAGFETDQFAVKAELRDGIDIVVLEHVAAAPINAGG
jgi:hypothetical protein